MKSEERRKEILRILKEDQKAVSGKELAAMLHVSRQVIVQDIALLRTGGEKIISTNAGYLYPQLEKEASRVFKVCHTDDEVEEELRLIVDNGGTVKDVFVYHKVYGVVRADLNISSRADIQKFLEGLSAGSSTLLKNITSNYHYHTVLAADTEILDSIQTNLEARGFLAPLRDYEPVDFWASPDVSNL